MAQIVVKLEERSCANCKFHTDYCGNIGCRLGSAPVGSKCDWHQYQNKVVTALHRRLPMKVMQH